MGWAGRSMDGQSLVNPVWLTTRRAVSLSEGVTVAVTAPRRWSRSAVTVWPVDHKEVADVVHPWPRPPCRLRLLLICGRRGTARVRDRRAWQWQTRFRGKSPAVQVAVRVETLVGTVAATTVAVARILCGFMTPAIAVATRSESLAFLLRRCAHWTTAPSCTGSVTRQRGPVCRPWSAACRRTSSWPRPWTSTGITVP